jgi:hypothetical protein
MSQFAGASRKRDVAAFHDPAAGSELTRRTADLGLPRLLQSFWFG